MTTDIPAPVQFDIDEYYSTYPSARERGFVEWAPQPKTEQVMRQVQAVIDEYRDHLPLTLRQVFYRLVGHHGYDKTENAYSRLGEYMNRARRAGMIRWDAIRDDGERTDEPWGYEDADHWWESTVASARGFHLHPREDQPLACTFLVEAAGMLPQVARVAKPYGIGVRSSGGFNSVTVTHRLAQHVRYEDRPTVFLHVGDYDPSGESVFDSLAADVLLFSRGMGAHPPEFYRVAVTEEHVARYDLPSAPAKRTDRRGDWHNSKLAATQAEAFAPDLLADIVRAACERFTDLDVLERVRQRGREISAQLVDEIESSREEFSAD